MDKSMKRQILVDFMDDRSKIILREFLQSHNKEMWERSEEKLHQDLSV